MVTWKGTAKEAAARIVTVYIDSLPTSLPINRVLPVAGEGNQLAVNPASENCVLMDKDTASLTPEQATKVKERSMTWKGVTFVCNIPNSLQNAVGTASTEGENKVTLTGTKGTRRYFIVYTDHAAHLDERTFPDMLRSFRAR